jgi:ABC-type uncharacterized transport system substrate-binding protein
VSTLGAPDGPGRRSLLRLAAAGALLATSVRAQARGELRVLLAAETAQHVSLVQALRSRWAQVTTYSEPTLAIRRRTAPLAYAAVGPRALQQALLVTLDAPLISVLVSRQAYTQLVEQAVRQPRGVTAVFAEASPAQQMRTIAAVMRRPVTVGALASDHSRALDPILKAAAESAGLSAMVQGYDPAIGMSRNLLRLAAADALLIYPDGDIYNPASLRELLESTYRRRQPVFGFSAALVEAGTLASAFANADDLAAHLVELLGTLAEGRLPAPQHPRYWRVAINDNVARSLDIVIDGATRSLGDRP